MLSCCSVKSCYGDTKRATPERGYNRQDYRRRDGKRERIVSWNGEENPPVQLTGTRLRVPVVRHNYRLLVIERK